MVLGNTNIWGVKRSSYLQLTLTWAREKVLPDENVPNLDGGGGYMNTYVYQKSSNLNA